MNRLFALCLFCALFPAFVVAQDYEGTVGRMEAVFTLEWHSDGAVTGSYYYPSRAGVSYSLRGSNHREGELYLEEFTGHQMTAKCFLRKRLTDSRIIWEGEMHNTDGRRFPMQFARTRAGRSASSSVPMTGHHASDAQSYTGQVGNLGAEFQLNWQESGTVSGTYYYPSRPGVTYQFVGSNPREGELHLDEYTNGEMTARCILSKRLTDTQIIWEGTMRNTDGRELAMSLVRARGAAMTEAPVAPEDDFSTDLEFSKRIRKTVTWTDFRHADEVIQRVPLFPENAVSMTARVESYSSSEQDGLKLVFRIGLHNESNWDDIRFEGPQVEFRASRHVFLPREKIVGRRIYLEYLEDGSLFGVTLGSIAVTHVRKSPRSEKLEARGLLDGEDLAHLDGLPLSGQRKAIERVDFISLLPDKLALSNWDDAEIYYRDLRIVKDYGITIQATGAGAGMLELETVSLEEPAEENPWLFLGGENRWDLVPDNQRTGEAG